MDARAIYLNNTAEFKAVAPAIGERKVFPLVPKINELITITATVTGTTSLVLLGHRGDKDDKFIKVTMLDDGLHQDGAANDGVYGATFFPDSKKVQYYVYAENNNAGIFYHNVLNMSIILLFWKVIPH